MIREVLPEVPVIALTASATPQVCQDIMEKLQFRKENLFQKSFRRENLRYLVLPEENIAKRIETIVAKVQGSGIIYARTRRLTERLAAWLAEQGHQTAAYHGGLKNSDRNRIQQAWIDNQIRVIVATNAFGMGIDKPDVRFVVHHNLPADLESYYQEAGRGGRDGKRALAIAFRNPSDIRELKRWGADKYPDFNTLQHHYQVLCQFYRIPLQGPVNEQRDFFVGELVKETGISALLWYHSLKLLDREGLLVFQEDPDDFAYVQVIATPADLHTFQEHHPRFESLIQYMLRTLGGEIFMRETRFLPDYWAHKMDLPPLDLLDQLLRMEQQGLIAYTPATENPSIRFLQPKRHLNKKELNWELYDFLREQQEFRLKAMLTYVEAEQGCRSNMLQEYFGEKKLEPCGIC
ncbi:MAG: helicase-related protein, partial [Bacteroidota bacterium]